MRPWSPPAPDDLFNALAATWPPARSWTAEGWVFRDGAGGGKRVSAASVQTEEATVQSLLAGFQAGQSPLASLRNGIDDVLSEELGKAGFAVVDPTILMAAPLEAVTERAGTPGAIASEMRLRAMERLWAAGGIGAARLAVMDRVPATDKAFLLARDGDIPAGAAFVAKHGRIAMLHAVEVAKGHRRRGLGARLTATAAAWAGAQSCHTLALAVTRANQGAQTLYSAVGMTEVASYHYRQSEHSNA